MVSFDFTSLVRTDFPLLAIWLAEPLVARWWNHETTPDALERDFGAAIDGTEPTDVYVVAANELKFGLIQCYEISAYPEYVREIAPFCSIPEHAVSVDYLIGEPRARGHGWAAAMIEQFLVKSASNTALVPVSSANHASWKSLEHAVFQHVADADMTPDNPIDSREHVIYRWDRTHPSRAPAVVVHTLR